MKYLPRKLKRWARLAVALWISLPILALAQALPPVDRLADTLLGRSVDYLLLVVALSAIWCTGYVVKQFIAYTIRDKETVQGIHEKHAAELKALHATTREDLRQSIDAINNLAEQARNTGLLRQAMANRDEADRLEGKHAERASLRQQGGPSHG